jgi:hypothetical protein
MMRHIAPIVAVIAVAAASSPALAALMRQAGEWQTSIDNGPPRLICYAADETIDQNYVARSMAKLPGANCKVSNFTTIGPYSMLCTVGGSQMTTTGSITVMGSGSVSGKAHSHGGMVTSANGRSVAIPDSDIVTPANPATNRGN